MTTKQRAALYETEKEINSRLAAMPANERPELSSRRRMQSVAYQARGCYQATDVNGNCETVTPEWLTKHGLM